MKQYLASFIKVYDFRKLMCPSKSASRTLQTKIRERKGKKV